jgi:C4-dicarboxylate transporter DctM subunit
VHREEDAPAAPAGASFGARAWHYLRTREMTPRTLVATILETTRLLATLLPLLCIAGSLNTILDHSGAPKQMVAALTGSIENRWVLMFLINVVLLIVRCLMDVGSAILILAPLLEPLAVAKGFDPIHFGIIMIANLEIGYLTPPVGLNLIVAMAAFKESFGTIVRACIPFVLIMLLWLLIVCVYPPLSLYLVGS